MSVNEKKHHDLQSRKAENLNWWVIFVTVLALTAFTRFYKVTQPEHVCWDETHFGKMGSWYINRTFFFDVHPPLGKMLIALSGYLTGYNGTFAFEKPGEKYNGTKYEGMRYFCTAFGAMIVPMAFDTVWDLTGSQEAAVVAAAYLIFDIGMLTINRYILLDPILLFFMVGSVWSMVKVSKFTKSNESYTFKWWFWLFSTGTMLSCTISVKFVGLFVVLLVGLQTINELWTILGDLNKPIYESLKQLFCRAIMLVIWPIILYTIFFYIHLMVLNRSGSGDGFYSSAFQSKLIGNSLHNISMPRKVAYGSIVTLKNNKITGGYLHSHQHLYPANFGAQQQQITTYTHKDGNNQWKLKPYNKESYPDVRIIKNGDLLRLEHVMTRRNLHSHNEQAPLTKKHYQVTGYGEDGIGDANDVFKIQIDGGQSDQELEIITSSFKLVHYLQNCVVSVSNLQLPKWAYEQHEVTCNPNLRDKNAMWSIEENKNEKMPNVSFQLYMPGFFSQFLESHAVMLQGNSNLKPKAGDVISRPWQWPINFRGQFFSGNDYRIYLLGNPVIWWSNLVFLMTFLIVLFITSVREKRQQRQQQLRKENQIHHQNLNLTKEAIFKKEVADEKPNEQQGHHEQKAEHNSGNDGSSNSNNNNSNSTDSGSCAKNSNKINKTAKSAIAKDESKKGIDDGRKQSLRAAVWLFVGWTLHYLPFWAMGRILYYHHYFPALIFNSMLTGVMYYYLTARLSRWLQHILLGTILSILVYSFLLFSPLSYGMTGPLSSDINSTYRNLKWLSTWEF